MTAATHLPLPLNLQSQQWYSIQTRYRFERKVTAQLQHKGLQTFLPLLEEFHRWSDRSQSIYVPLFSGYTFARFDLSAGLRMELLHTEGVIGLISVRGVAIPIPAKQIDGISNDGVLLIHGDTPSALNSAWVGGCRRLPLETAARGRFRSSDQG